MRHRQHPVLIDDHAATLRILAVTVLNNRVPRMIHLARQLGMLLKIAYHSSIRQPTRLPFVFSQPFDHPAALCVLKRSFPVRHVES